MLLAAFIIIFSQFSHAQQVIPLNIIKGGNVDFKINATPPYFMYVSALEDSDAYLKQIFVKTDNNNQMPSIDTLKNSKENPFSGLLTPFKIQWKVHFSSNLTDEQMQSLSGFIYITTTKQAREKCFRVYDVDQSQIIKTERCPDGNCTLVFLNTNAQTLPVQSSTISNWHQSDDSVVKMFKGYPKDDEEIANTHIFSNPIVLSNTPLFIPTVEQFTVSLNIFYLKITNYLYFNIKPIFTDLDGYTTTGYHSTGFHMKSRIQETQKVTVFCLRDTRYNGTTGVNLIGSLPDPNGRVQVLINDDLYWEVTPSCRINPWNDDGHGNDGSLTITSKHSNDGEFFLQYYFLRRTTDFVELSSYYSNKNC